MDDIRHSALLSNKAPTNGIKNDFNQMEKRGVFDPRLLLFGYTTETIQMLLVPMLKTK